MDYYLLEEDKRISKPLSFDAYSKGKNNDFCDVVIQVNIYPTTKVIDYKKNRTLFKSNHIFTDKIKNLLEAYNSRLKFNAIFITADNFKTQYAYWELVCDTVKKIVVKNSPIQKNFQLDSKEIKKEIIFIIIYEKQDYIVFREDLVESIMRRQPLGIKFKQINLI